MAPVKLSACTIPTAAEADWSKAVKSAPTRMPMMGFDIFVSALMNHADSLRPPTEEDMTLMPIISTAKPMRISPI